MWLLLNNSYLSVVKHLGKAETLLVRSRIQGDIERAIPTAEVYEDPSADYRYRADVPREVFKKAMEVAIDEIEYSNFKGSVKDPVRHNVYMRVWSVLADAFGAYGK